MNQDATNAQAALATATSKLERSAGEPEVAAVYAARAQAQALIGIGYALLALREENQ